MICFRPLLRAWALAAGLAPAAAPACDLALILAVDVSGSVDNEEYRIQMGGLASALRDDTVADALIAARAHLALIQWTGRSRQVVTLPWRPVTDRAALDAFAQAVARDPRRWRNFSTAIGEALILARDTFAQGPDCARRVVDVSGDGVSNEGRPPETLGAELAAADITVNALAIAASDGAIRAYYRERVIAGPGAFIVTAPGFADYPAAILRKLRAEVSERTVFLLPGER